MRIGTDGVGSIASTHPCRFSKHVYLAKSSRFESTDFASVMIDDVISVPNVFCPFHGRYPSLLSVSYCQVRTYFLITIGFHYHKLGQELHRKTVINCYSFRCMWRQTANYFIPRRCLYLSALICFCIYNGDINIRRGPA